MGTGKPVTYQNWNAGEPNNFEYEDGEQEHCLEMCNSEYRICNGAPCIYLKHTKSVKTVVAVFGLPHFIPFTNTL